jgi:hypothetical protein
MTDIFPFAPNWSEAPQVTLSYKTDIFTSRSGKEQRRASRMTPRRTHEFTSFAHQDDMLAFKRLLAVKQNANFLFPDWTRLARTYGIADGATYFSLREIAPEWLAAGATVFLCDGDVVTTATILLVEAYTVRLTAPVAQVFAPSLVLRPAYEGQLANIATTLNTSNTITAKIGYDVIPGSHSNSDNLSFAYLVDGKEVFAFLWNWGKTTDAEYSWQIENVDFGRGLITTHRPVDFGKVSQTVSVVRRDDAEIDYMLRFVERQKGQRAQFWMPSGTADLTLAADVSAYASTITVEGSSATNEFGDSPVYRGVAIYLRDGRKVFRRVISSIVTSGDSVLQLSAPVSFGFTAEQVGKICWLTMARFASDDASFTYASNSVAEWQTQTVTVTYSADVMDFTPFDGAANWTMDSWGEETDALLEALDYATNIAMPFGDVAAMGLGAFDDLINSELWEALG